VNFFELKKRLPSNDVSPYQILQSEKPEHTTAPDSLALDSPEYQAWQRRFLHQRLNFGLKLAIPAYFTFIGLRLLSNNLGPIQRVSSWPMMAACAVLGMALCLGLQQTRMGRRYPGVLFLGASWSVTLVEQVWGTLNGFALPGLFSWTLTFLAQATLSPVRWPLHLTAQMGVLGYYFIVNSFLGLSPPDQPLWNPVQVLYLAWFCGICTLSVGLYERLQRAEFHTRLALEAEREKSESLLLNILPEAVARQLMQEQRTIAESFTEATVLFADLVGFTQISSGIPPHELVQLLNQVFSTFDHLAEKHQLEKIKTIGDAYMVVGGLPVQRPDHVEAIAEMALEMQAAIAQVRTSQGEPLKLRIGINTGPVIAGVIGIKKFIYDLWGDTVNIASRMESNGLAGYTQVTEAVYERLKHQYTFEKRGAIQIKGKGEMTTYLLQHRLPPVSGMDG
jgi:adenylate cyclase